MEKCSAQGDEKRTNNPVTQNKFLFTCKEAHNLKEVQKKIQISEK